VWSDYDDPKGFHVFDTETREIEFVKHDLTLFEKYHYDDLDKERDDVVLDGYSFLNGKFVKVIVRIKQTHIGLTALSIELREQVLLTFR
jgi:hypothetical protein